jgi:hypothetical protein
MYLLGLLTEDLLSGRLQLALVSEIGHVGRMLVHSAEFTGHLALVAAENAVVLSFTKII